MVSSRNWIASLTSLVLMLSANVSFAERYTVRLNSNSVTTISPESETWGKYYLVRVSCTVIVFA